MRDDWRSAATQGDSEVIERLLAQGVDVDSLDNHGQTALMLAALHGRDAVVRVLLDNGADMNMTAKYNLSALMLAVINRHTTIAKQLVHAGANTPIRGSGAPGFVHKTARELAEQAGLDDLATYIAQVES
jgi:ankyrin repeat protein